MANGDDGSDNALAPSRPIIASPFTAKEAAGNLLWQYAKELPSAAWNLISAPGKVYTGELTPSMEPGPNLLSVPEYALNLAGTGLGVGGLTEAAGLRTLEQGGAVTPQFGAFHGTPAAPFPRFADEFMGTGEGAQAYSWGHYVAQAPGTGKSYVPQARMDLSLDGKPWEWKGDSDSYDQDLAYNQLLSTHGDIDEAANRSYARAEELNQRINDPDEYVTEGMKDVRDDHYAAADFLTDNRDRIGVHHRPEGNFANVWVKPDHDEFLDWDLPFSKQPPGVQEKLLQMPGSSALKVYNPSGKDIYNALASGHRQTAAGQGLKGFEMMTEASRLASKELDANGIPGTRFADQNSRGIQVSPLYGPGNKVESWQVFRDNPYSRSGENDVLGEHPTREAAEAHADSLRTYNYVLYDPNNIEITHWNGQPVSKVDHDPFDVTTP